MSRAVGLRSAAPFTVALLAVVAALVWSGALWAAPEGERAQAQPPAGSSAPDSVPSEGAADLKAEDDDAATEQTGDEAADGSGKSKSKGVLGPLSIDTFELRIGALMQMWWTMREGAENGLLQPLSRDEAAQEASGFSYRRARLSVDFDADVVRGRLSLRLEGSPPGLLDGYGVIPLLDPWLEIWAGQMKIPATDEVGTASQDLDFVSRSLLSQRVVDLTLSQSPAQSSPRFAGVKTYLRDLGVALKGKIFDGHYFLMVGNGLGANRFIGGSEWEQEVFANSFGAYFYAGRLGYAIVPPKSDGSGDPVSVEIGGHLAYNYHPDIMLDDERTVLDLQRRSYSADLQVHLGDFIRLAGLFGSGDVLDDFDQDDRVDYAYRGWSASLVLVPLPGTLELGHRYEGYADERYENGSMDVLHAVTMGATYMPWPMLKVQLNYKWKLLDSDTEPDVDDDVAILMLQAVL